MVLSFVNSKELWDFLLLSSIAAQSFTRPILAILKMSDTTIPAWNLSTETITIQIISMKLLTLPTRMKMSWLLLLGKHTVILSTM